MGSGVLNEVWPSAKDSAAARVALGKQHQSGFETAAHKRGLRRAHRPIWYLEPKWLRYFLCASRACGSKPGGAGRSSRPSRPARGCSSEQPGQPAGSGLLRVAGFRGHEQRTVGPAFRELPEVDSATPRDSRLHARCAAVLWHGHEFGGLRDQFRGALESPGYTPANWALGSLFWRFGRPDPWSSGPPEPPEDGAWACDTATVAKRTPREFA